MAQLAIKGHATRGKEIIEILEMLGGKNVFNLTGDETMAYYIIENKEIKGGIYIFGNEPYFLLTLEEFLEKFPYKVGDKVYFNSVPHYKCEVDEMYWNYKSDSVTYIVKHLGRVGYGCKMAISAKQLKSYKKETMEEGVSYY